MEEALERFQGQFNNRYIDSLCITVMQAMESGQAVELLTDIADQIRDMELTLQGRRPSMPLLFPAAALCILFLYL